MHGFDLNFATVKSVNPVSKSLPTCSSKFDSRVISRSLRVYWNKSLSSVTRLLPLRATLTAWIDRRNIPVYPLENVEIREELFDASLDFCENSVAINGKTSHVCVGSSFRVGSTDVSDRCCILDAAYRNATCVRKSSGNSLLSNSNKVSLQKWTWKGKPNSQTIKSLSSPTSPHF